MALDIRITGTLAELKQLQTDWKIQAKIYPNRGELTGRIYLRQIKLAKITKFIDLNQMPQPKPYDAVLGSSETKVID